jgi:hypothetical protein
MNIVIIKHNTRKHIVMDNIVNKRLVLKSKRKD